ncbi:MAG: hypothetical protein ACREPB_04840 [Arenimonas sp.]
MREYRLDDLAHQALLVFGQATELFELLLQFRRWPAFARVAQKEWGQVDLNQPSFFLLTAVNAQNKNAVVHRDGVFICVLFFA